MKTDFLEEASDRIGSPEVLINVVSRRVRQLGQGYRPLVPVDPRWSFLDVALKEIVDGKLTFDLSRSDEGRKNTKMGGKRRRSS